MSPESTTQALQQGYNAARNKARSDSLPFYVTLAQFGRVACADPAETRLLEDYLLDLPEDSIFPLVEPVAGATQITSKTLRWHALPVAEPEPEPVAVAPTPVAVAPEAEPPTEIITLSPRSEPATPAAAPNHPRLIAYYSVLRQRLSGSGVPFRISIDALGEAPHRIRGNSFPLRRGLLEMPAHLSPIVSVVHPNRGFVAGNVTWEANGFIGL